MSVTLIGTPSLPRATRLDQDLDAVIERANRSLENVLEITETIRDATDGVSPLLKESGYLMNDADEVIEVIVHGRRFDARDD